MAESKSVMAVVPLNGSNYPTWKVQCRMALMKDGLWSIVEGTEEPPAADNAELTAKFAARRDRALAIIVLAVDPLLLYLLGDPDDPVTVWNKLSSQFQKKSWANKLELRKKLYSLRLKEGDSVQEHIRKMTVLFEELAVVGDAISEEDRVVHLLASLPESFNMLVTALEANSTVPDLEVVIDRLLHEEKKLQVKEPNPSKALPLISTPKKIPKCFHCGKPGHFKRDCRKLIVGKERAKDKSKGRSGQVKANKASANQQSDSETDALVVEAALCGDDNAEEWIVDSGATCHMCRDKKLFIDLHPLGKETNVSVGDGHKLNVAGQGAVLMSMNLPDGKTRKCRLKDVLYVPSLSYNLMSVSKAAENGKVTQFDENGCRILDRKGDLLALAQQRGSLYYLRCGVKEQVNVAKQRCKQITLWHRRFGHLGVGGLKSLVRDSLVSELNCKISDEPDFCEACTSGKHKRFPFKASNSHSTEPLGLVHSDVCGKMNLPSLGGAIYFVTFIDDFSHYTWVYLLKRKSEVFEKFQKWKALVENASGRKLKVLRTDQGGEYMSNEFKAFLESTGVRHEHTVPKTPEQNGVAERMNRTLIETVRSMLADANLPHEFWAEALSTAVYLRNRSPTKTLLKKTPFQAWMGKKPSVGHLRVFGCKAYAHVPKDERGKLDSKSKQCIFVGYGEEARGYRLYDPIKKRICLSRDVLFNENASGTDIELGEKRRHYFYIDFSSQEQITQENEQVTVNEVPTNEDHFEEPEIEDQIDAPEPEAEQGVRRSRRERRFPDYYGFRLYLSQEEPTSVKEALKTSEKDCWLTAMKKEMNSLHQNDVWDLVERPENRKLVGSKWIFKTKTNAAGQVERYKARLVAQGFSQVYGKDYDETFCPVVRMESIRTLIAMAVQRRMHLHQVDITTAFLHGELVEEVYMELPEGFVTPGSENLVCKLKKSIYGLKTVYTMLEDNSGHSSYINGFSFHAKPTQKVPFQISTKV
jgi:hypothetical protein